MGTKARFNNTRLYTMDFAFMNAKHRRKEISKMKPTFVSKCLTIPLLVSQLCVVAGHAEDLNQAEFSRALRGALRGPEEKKVNIYGHEFNIKPVQISEANNTVTATGILSHHLSVRPDDQISYRVTYTDGALTAVHKSIYRGGWAKLAGQIGSAIANYYGVPISPDRIEGVGNSLGQWMDGNWESACDFLIANIGLRIADYATPKTIPIDPLVKSIQPSSKGPFIPSHVPWYGDRDFDGHGPYARIYTRLYIKNENELWANVSMYARETTSDWTYVYGGTDYLLYRHNRQITEILSDTYSSEAYIDDDHATDIMRLSAKELVSRYICVGDTDGEEAGSRTAVTVEFNRICFKESDQPMVPLKTVSLSQKVTPFFIPPHTGGDKEFGGHGPNVVVSAKLSVRNNNQIWATLSMTARETESDWTAASGSNSYLIYQHNKTIKRILSDTFSTASYRDSNHAYDILRLQPEELTATFLCLGDTSGDEAGSRTGVRAYFNTIRFEESDEIPPPAIVQVSARPTPKFVPRHTRGDRDFHGNGPNTSLSSWLSIRNGNQIWATISMTAKETKSDWTTASGYASYLVYQHHRPIQRILSDTYSSFSYTDRNHNDDTLSLPTGESVNKFICVGDTRGDEAGSRTGVTVYFNPIRIQEATP